MPILTVGTGRSLFYNPPVVAAASYVGLGDLAVSLAITEPTNYWGMRAYKEANIATQNIIDITYNDTTVITYKATASGMLDLATIAADTVTHGAPAIISKWYDQKGGVDLTSAGNPEFSASPTGQGAGTATVAFDGGAGDKLSTTSGITQSQPFFISAVGRRNSGTNFSNIYGAQAAAPGLIWANSANAVMIFAGSVPTVTCSDAATHTIGALFNGASSQGYIDGSAVGGAVSSGASVFSGGNQVVGNFNGDAVTGYITEIAIFGYDASASADEISANQKHATNGYNF